MLWVAFKGKTGKRSVRVRNGGIMKAVAGAALICVCFFLLGRKATERDRTAVKQLYEILKLTRHIKDCISISLTPLPDIYDSFEFDKKYMVDFEKALKTKGLAPFCLIVILSTNGISSRSPSAALLVTPYPKSPIRSRCE